MANSLQGSIKKPSRHSKKIDYARHDNFQKSFIQDFQDCKINEATKQFLPKYQRLQQQRLFSLITNSFYAVQTPFHLLQFSIILFMFRYKHFREHLRTLSNIPTLFYLQRTILLTFRYEHFGECQTFSNFLTSPYNLELSHPSIFANM